MNSVYRYIIIGLLILVFISCEEDVNFFGEGDSNYVLSCIIVDGDSNHFAYLTKSYEIEAETQSGNSYNAVKNAFIELNEDGKTFYFRDTLLLKNNQGEIDSIWCYVLTGYELKPDNNLQIQCRLPNGETIFAETHTSPDDNHRMSRIKTQIPPGYSWEDTDGFVIEFGERDQVRSGYFYYPSLTVDYTKATENDEIIHRKEIPSRVVEINGSELFYYPYSVYYPDVYYELEALKLGLLDICEEGFEPYNYKIVNTNFAVYSPDKNLAKYHEAGKALENSFNILIVKPSYSNIDGGRGIFATSMKASRKCSLRRDIVENLGFRSIY